MGRLVAYLVTALVGSAILAVLVITKGGVVPLLWAISWAGTVFVTWRVAQRQGRRPWLWSLIALLVGPFAWMFMAAFRGAEADSA